MMNPNFKIDRCCFLSDSGEFQLDNPDKTGYLYFPLANEAGMMSSITPSLNGDAKTGQSSFLLTPVSAEDLHNNRSARNFWLFVDGYGPWSVSGNSALQKSGNFSGTGDGDRGWIEAGFLWHRVIRENLGMGIRTETTGFVPVNNDTVELMRVTITNIGQNAIRIWPTAAIPIYGRSADNLRDHRHVTALFHRIETTSFGVEVKPTLRFDERGHKINQISYMVLGADENGTAPVGFFPVVEEFIGEGGSLDWPEKIVRNSGDFTKAEVSREGYEAIGALRFQDIMLEPSQSKSYILVMAINQGHTQTGDFVKEYCNGKQFTDHMNRNREFWNKKLSRLTFYNGDSDWAAWMRWVSLQPILRRIYGCSFLPHHDYGRGGRGWRDLWQDCLALLMLDPSEVRQILLNNFAGVRIDGSNATIIGSNSGEFIADRNNISRVWMDHGAWPFITTRIYLDQTGDLEFLLENQTYFKDRQIHRSKQWDLDWRPEDGNQVIAVTGSIYQGSILEHVLLQNITQFFNVGEHNTIRLEGADWNDAMDMAAEKGESVAFTALYCYNLREISQLIRALEVKTGRDRVELAEEILRLFDTLTEKIDYNSVTEKRALLQRFFDSCRNRVSGLKIPVKLSRLADDLDAKADWLTSYIRNQEWISNAEGYRWFNGYYNNDGVRVEGDHPAGVRMTLTGQVFPIMSGIASPEQIRETIRAVDRYLKDPQLGGYRLNTDFGGIQTNLGRGFGFAFGHKENGAVFSHMVVMYANALYRRGFIREGYQVLQSLYTLSSDFGKSRIYPGIPEYFDAKGRGMYHYLTGSASWYIYTVLQEVYGVKGYLGDLALEPKLVAEQFDGSGIASVTTVFNDRKLDIRYHNPAHKDYGEYYITNVTFNGFPVNCKPHGTGVLITRDKITKLNCSINQVEVMFE